MLIDAHAHVDRYKDDLPEAIAQIENEPILTVSVSMDVASYERALDISKSSSYILPIFGIHPWEAHRYSDRLTELDSYVQRSPMIGEIGLDFHFIKDEALYPKQIRVFEYLLSLAHRLNKPMNLHTKGAEGEVLSALQRFNISSSIIHWYSGPISLIESFLAANCYFTVGVEVISSPKIQIIAQIIPVDRLLTETDNPGGFQSLTKTRGMPIMLRSVISKLAEIRKEDPHAIEQQVFINFSKITKEIRQYDKILESNK